ncbi:hypothetical protein EV356DRAFT_497234 [Viridothelium virens]|uniref:Uncharacterized protein n=1 Tax=Viridothelium virens TaxID=1048519 RepID=A0A6A6HFS2_VIRVR|nr:hypothetical protein EV356DRAFT_497234 [Viridothelium virens]
MVLSLRTSALADFPLPLLRPWVFAHLFPHPSGTLMWNSGPILIAERISLVPYLMNCGLDPHLTPFDHTPFTQFNAVPSQ